LPGDPQGISDEPASHSNGPPPGFDAAAAEERVKLSYEHLFEAAVDVLPSLKKAEWYRKLVGTLRAEGWLDWQILGAVITRAWNHRAQAQTRLQGLPPRAGIAIFRKLASNSERVQWGDFPPEGVPLHEVRQQESINALSVLQGRYGRTSGRSRPNLDAIMRVLVEQLGYRSIDVAHASILD
jgi:hypothetical protein